MQKEEIKTFFDNCAPTWDDEMIKDDEIISLILNNTQINEKSVILDVATGTGVMIPYYLDKGVLDITGIDLSTEMIKIAKSKYGNISNINLICGDVETENFEKKFNRIMIYNAFPHFQDPNKLISILNNYLESNGILSIAHGMSREKINQHHQGIAKKYSLDLLPANELANIISKYMNVTTCISNDYMYQVCGIKD